MTELRLALSAQEQIMSTINESARQGMTHSLRNTNDGEVLIDYILDAQLWRSPTKRALDAGDSAAFSSILLASSFLCSQAESTPAPAPVTPAVGWLRQNNKVSKEKLCPTEFS